MEQPRTHARVRKGVRQRRNKNAGTATDGSLGARSVPPEVTAQVLSEREGTTITERSTKI